MPTINVVFLGPSKDLANVSSLSLSLGEKCTVAAVKKALVERLPRLAPAMPSIRLAVNHSFAADDAVVSEGDEVALIPPVSGGSNGNSIWVELVKEPITLDRVRAFMKHDPSCGATAMFEGSARSEWNERGKSLHRLEYEAYSTMAERQLEALAGEAIGRWSLGKVAMIHRLGAVAVGEVSVVVAVAAAHRAECFDACKWLIDTVKRDVPIWKKDVYEDGTEKWVEPTSTTILKSSPPPCS